MTFEAKILKLGDRSLPPSLPLVVHSNQEWLMEKNQLVKIQEESEGEDNREEEGSKALLKIVPDTLALLKSVNKPIAVVSICGPFRTGKSYLLSQILGSPGAFKVGHSMGACTKGVWMATTVLECEDYVVVLLDTEGMDSPEDESADVSKLLIVTTLLSSLMIYNSQTAPDWNDLEDLRSAIVLHVRVGNLACHTHACGGWRVWGHSMPAVNISKLKFIDMFEGVVMPN